MSSAEAYLDFVKRVSKAIALGLGILATTSGLLNALLELKFVTRRELAVEMEKSTARLERAIDRLREDMRRK